MKVFLLILLNSMLLSCGKMDLNTGPLSGSTIIGGSVQPLSGLISQHSNQKSFLSNAYAAPCNDAVTASLYTLSDSGEQSSAPVMTYDVKSDAEYSFDLKALGTLDSKVQYMVEVTGCDYLFSRPVTAINLEQHINYATTFISFATNANLSKNLREVLRTELDEFLKQMQGNSFNSVYMATHSDSALTAQFQSLFGSNISALNEAAPKIVYYRIPSLLPELTTGSYEIKTIHPDPAYNTVYKWKLDGALKSSAQLWNYSPNGNDQGTHLVTLYIGKDDGSGSIDLSSRYLLRTFLINVPNNITPIPPNISIANSTISNPNIQIDLDTAFALSNCDTFEKLALTENMTAAPTNPALYNITCTQAVSQAIPFTVSNGNGLKVLRLWAMDSSGAISSTPKILNITKTGAGSTSPSTSASSLSLAASSLLSGSSTTITLTVRDSGNNILAAGGETVTFAQAGGASTSTISSVTDNGDGTYTATLTGVMSGAATTLTAYINGNPVTSSNPTLTVEPGSMSSIAFTIQPSPLSVTADTEFTIQPIINAYDTNSNLVSTDSTSTVSLSAYDSVACGGSLVAGGLGGTISKTLSNGIGVFTNVKLLKTSVRSIKAVLGSITTCSTTMGVNPGPLASLAFTTQPSSTSNADSSIGSPVVTAYDANGNIKTDFTGTVNIIGSSDGVTCGTGSDVSSSVSSSSQTAIAGVATFGSLSVNNVAAITLRAYIGSIHACSNNFTITPGVVNAIATISGNGQTYDSLTSPLLPIVHEVQDAHGNAVRRISRFYGGCSRDNFDASGSFQTDTNGRFQCTLPTAVGFGNQTISYTFQHIVGYDDVWTFCSDCADPDWVYFPISISTTITYPSLAWATNTHNFGNILLTGNATKTFTLTNSGNKAAICSAPALSGAHPSQYSITNDTCAGNSLAAGASCTLDVVSNPTSVGTKTATLSRTCSFGGTVSTSTNGLTSLSYSATTLTFNPTSRNFYNVPNGISSGYLPMLITNNGSSTAIACSGAISGTNASDFSIGPNACGATIAPGASCNVQVQATPGALGARSGTLTYTCANGSISAAISVTGIAPAAASHTPLATTIALGNVVVGKYSSTYDLYLTNNGAVSTAGCSAFTNTNNTDFTITDVDCGTNATVPGGRCLLQIKANPASSGVKTSTLARSCTSGGATGSISLTTTGRTSTPTIAPIFVPTTVPDIQPQLSAGRSFTCTLLSDGRVSCWGENGIYQLGNGVATDSKTPVIASVIDGATDATTAISISSGNRHSCALMKNYTIKCWGDNLCGSSGACSLVGDGTVVASRSTPTTTSLIIGASDATKASSISTGGDNTCAVMFDGSVKCWGENGSGQLGDGTYTDSTSPVAVAGIDGATSGTFATSVASGSQFNCAIMSNGTIKCWGSNIAKKLGNNSAVTNSNTPVGVLYYDGSTASKTAEAVALGYATACALDQAGTVRCWGTNAIGTAGVGGGPNPTSPTNVVKGDLSNLANITAISSGEGAYSFCALTSAKEVYCWGDNSSFQLGDGTHANALYAIKVSGITTAEIIAVGADHACTTLTNKSIECWGYNAAGELGDNKTIAQTTAYQVQGVTIARYTASSYGGSNCALLTNGAISCWGTDMENYTIAPNTNNFNAFSLSAGIYNYVLRNDSNVYFWYNNYFYYPSLTANQITGTYNSTCALQGGSISCWGENGLGQLGNNSIVDEPNVAGSSVSGISPLINPAISITAGSGHYCAILADRTVVCWGYNASKQVGDGTTTNALAPTTVYNIAGDSASGALSNVSQMALTHSSTCALLTDSTVKCWGANSSGQIGEGGNLAKPNPTVVTDAAGSGTLTNVISLASTTNTVCALLSNGRVQCWGSNAFGGVGNGSFTNRLLPTTVPGLNSIIAISSGSFSSSIQSPICATSAAGSVYCWGYNRYSGTSYDESQIRSVSGF
jgi:alpha-tubulin suppressor-like RCC1 family protein